MILFDKIGKKETVSKPLHISNSSTLEFQNYVKKRRSHAHSADAHPIKKPEKISLRNKLIIGIFTCGAGQKPMQELKLRRQV
jgi:hypothetical protein